MKRRDFFTKGCPSYFYKLGSAFIETSEINKEEKDYFESFETCYPLLAEVPMDMMIQAAEKIGIPTENKTKITLAREIYALKGVRGFE